MQKTWIFAFAVLAFATSLPAQSQRAQGDTVGYLTANPYLGTEPSPYDPLVSRYSPNGANNPYTTQGAEVYGEDGQYLGRLNANRYDPESVANPYGEYGSQYSPKSVNNPYGEYGSPYSPKSATNPYTTTPPVLVLPDPYGDSSDGEAEDW